MFVQNKNKKPSLFCFDDDFIWFQTNVLSRNTWFEPSFMQQTPPPVSQAATASFPLLPAPPCSSATGSAASRRFEKDPPVMWSPADRQLPQIAREKLSSPRQTCLPWSRVTAVPSTGLESIDGVITKFLQDKDSLHCIALFNVTQLYENLKTENGEGKNKQKQDRTLLTQQQWMKNKSKVKNIYIYTHTTRTHTHALNFIDFESN